MGLMYDDPRLAALTLLRIAAKEAEGPTELTGRMQAVLDDLVQRNGSSYLAELAIALARTGFIALDDWPEPPGTTQPSCWTRSKSTSSKASMMDSRVGAGLPAGLAPPVNVALARAVTKMPRAGALPGNVSV
jgi:hypothetical protein